MPAPPSGPGSGGASRPLSTAVVSYADRLQIASSNATAQAFLGRRQPAWLNPNAAATSTNSVKKLSAHLTFSRQPAVKPPQAQAQAQAQDQNQPNQTLAPISTFTSTSTASPTAQQPQRPQQGHQQQLIQSYQQPQQQ